MQLSFKKILPHLLVLIGFVVVSLWYFSPVLQGKSIFQNDIKQYIGMSKQQKDFKKQTGEETYWTNSAFGGMPTYQLGAKYPHNYIKKLDLTLRFLPRPADYLFLYLLCFYILLIVLKVDYRLAAVGALAFGFSTYLIIILGVGHNSKAHAIAYMPLVLSGIILTFRRKYIAGFLLTTVAMGLEIVSNHFQMTYYLLLLVIVLGIVYLIDAYKKQALPHYFKSVGILILAVILSIGLNATGVLATQEYVKESTRGKSELTINSNGSSKEVTSGLDRDYITQFSYGKVETFNLYIPRFMGGGNYENLGKDSHTYKAYRKLGASHSQALDASEYAPMYWGEQPIVEAPAYIGAVILFLFVLGLFLVKGRLKWWLVSGTLLSLLLSYGKNLGFLTDFFIDYVPLYNKFRAVSSIQVILELCIPVLGIFALVRLLNDFERTDEKLKALKYSTIITGGMALIFLLFKNSLFDFSGASDGQYIQNYGQDFIRSIKDDRRAIFTADTLRTLVLVLLAAGTIYMFLKEKLKEKWVILIFGGLILFDLIGVDRRYVNNDDFIASIKVNKPFSANAADVQIHKDKGHFRVFDITNEGLQNRTRASYFHNSLNGYNAAELKRYREVFDFYVAKNNLNVLNMLNTKYIMVDGEDGKVSPLINDEANGNAWFVEKLERVNSANEEILALDSLDTKKKAVYTVNNSNSLIYKKVPESKLKEYLVDSIASIILKEVQPNYLKYESNNTNDGFAVFSEIYYGNGWKTLIDGKPASHKRVNYTLRGMEIPKGKHLIEFKFDPDVVKTGSSIALTSSILLFILLVGGLFLEFKKNKTTSA